MARNIPKQWDVIAKTAVEILRQMIDARGLKIKTDVSFVDRVAMFTFDGGREYVIPVSKQVLEVWGLEHNVRRLFAELIAVLTR